MRDVQKYENCDKEEEICNLKCFVLEKNMKHNNIVKIHTIKGPTV